MKLGLRLLLSMHWFFIVLDQANAETFKCKRDLNSPPPLKVAPLKQVCGDLRKNVDMQIHNLINAIQKAYPYETVNKSSKNRHTFTDAFVESYFYARAAAMSGNNIAENLELFKENLASTEKSYSEALEKLKNFDQKKQEWEDKAPLLQAQMIQLENASKAHWQKKSDLIQKNDPQAQGLLEKYDKELEMISVELQKVTDQQSALMADNIDFSLSKEENEKKIKQEYGETTTSLKTVIYDMESQLALANGKEGKPSIKKENYYNEFQYTLRNIKSSPRFKDCGFTDEELIAIAFYTGNGYRSLNKALWEKDTKTLEKYKVLIQRLNSGLAKIDPFEGMVKRGANLPEKEIKKYCLGCVVKVETFVSTSAASGFGGEQKFIIKSKSGSYIDPLSVNSGEEEVLFQTGTKFKVVNIDGDKYTLIEEDR